MIIGVPSVKQEIHRDNTVVIDLVPISEITNVKVKKKSTAKESKAQSKPESAEKVITESKEVPPFKPKDTPKPAPLLKEQLPAVSPQSTAKTKVDSSAVALKNDIKPKMTPQNVKPEAVKKQVTPPTSTSDSAKKKKEKKNETSKVVLKSLKTETTKKEDKNTLESMFQELEDALEGETDKEFNPEMEMTMSEIDSIRNQIKRAWNPIAFSGSGKIMQVTLLINLDKNGTVISVKSILESNSNPSYGVFVESVIRATKKASPLQNLSLKKFQSWKEMEIHFTSEEMIY